MTIFWGKTLKSENRIGNSLPCGKGWFRLFSTYNLEPLIENRNFP